jgi:phage tail sheath protein FI
MPIDPIFGVVARRVDDESSPAIYADLDTVGIIGPAPDADPLLFPLNTPVKFNSDNFTLIASIGARGFIQDGIRGVNDQLADFERAAQFIFVRTALGTDSNPSIALQETLANIMGDSALGTGLNAFVQSAELVHAIPRLIMAPGYTGQLVTGLDTLVMSTPGTGYVPDQSYPITFSGGGPNVVQAAAHAIANPDGTLAAPIIDNFGAFYSTTPTATIAAPVSGTRALYTATTAVNADPVCAAMPSVLSQLIAHAVVESTGTSTANDETWRGTLNSDRLIPMSGGVKIVDPVSGSTIVMPCAPRVIGCIIRRDFQTGAPFNSAANQAVNGIVGPARSIPFNITDGANEGQELLGFNVGIIVRGELGNDFALAQGGYILVATDNAGEDTLWMFYNVTRGRDFINITLIRNLRFYLGKYNITAQTVQVVVNSMVQVLSFLKAQDNLLGYKVSFSGSLNTSDEIRKGNITISFRAEEPTVLRKITAQGSRYRPAVDALILQLESQLVVTG